jgi:hypothetical protein
MFLLTAGKLTVSFMKEVLPSGWFESEAGSYNCDAHPMGISVLGL